MDRPLRIEVIDDATAAMFRRFTPAERFAKIDEMYRAARWTILAGGPPSARGLKGGAAPDRGQPEDQR